MVVYHGPKAWDGPTSMEEISTLEGEALERYGSFLPSFRFFLVDLSQLSRKELARWPLTPRGRLALALLKEVRHREDWLELVEESMKLFAAAAAESRKSRRLQPFLVYILRVRKGGEREKNALAELFGRRLGWWAREEVMSIADELEKKGRREGRREGRAEEAREVLLRLMERRFGPVSAESRQRVDRAELVQVRGWIDRLFEASTAEDLLGE